MNSFNRHSVVLQYVTVHEQIWSAKIVWTQTWRNDVINMLINVTSPAATSVTKSCGETLRYIKQFIVYK